MRVFSAGMAVFSVVFLLSGCASSPSAVATPKPEKNQREEQCYQEFSALKKLDPAAYEKYRNQFNAINENYAIYAENQPLIDGSSSEVMLTEINKTLSLVCMRIKNAVYSNMMDRADVLSNL